MSGGSVWFHGQANSNMAECLFSSAEKSQGKNTTRIIMKGLYTMQQFHWKKLVQSQKSMDWKFRRSSLSLYRKLCLQKQPEHGRIFSLLGQDIKRGSVLQQQISCTWSQAAHSAKPADTGSGTTTLNHTHGFRNTKGWFSRWDSLCLKYPDWPRKQKITENKHFFQKL